MLAADARTIPNGWMINKRVPAGVISRRSDGLLRVVCPDGTVDLVAGHRVDLAQALATGLLTPQRRANAPPRPAQAAPAGSGFTRDQVNVLGDVFAHIGKRLRALEGKAKAKAPPRPSANVGEAKARAALAMARARTALQRSP